MILDLSMPGLSSEEVLAQLRSIRGSVPVVVSSGHPQAEVSSRFPASMVQGYLPKPYRSATLREMVGDVVRESRDRARP